MVVTNLQLLSLLSKPHRDGCLTGGSRNMLGNDDDDDGILMMMLLMIIMMMISSLAPFFEISEIS